MHLNIRSLNKHMGDLYNLLSLLPFAPGVIRAYASPNLVLVNQWLISINLVTYSTILSRNVLEPVVSYLGQHLQTPKPYPN